MADQATIFESPSVPPPGGSTEFSLHLWDSIRSATITPRFHSEIAGDGPHRLEFLTGARLMGYELEPWDPERRLLELTDPAFASAERIRRRKAGYFEQLVPQQLLIADILGVHHDDYAFEISRRASKTTTLFLAWLGRLATRPGYFVTFSAQNGVLGSRRLREWAGRLDAVNPPDDQDLPPWLRGRKRTTARHDRSLALFGDDVLPEDYREQGPRRRGFKIMRGEVGKGIYFDNGSQFLVLKPEADAYRSEGADVSWLDEMQEIDPDEGDDLIAAIGPLQDTKLGSSLVRSGTAGEARVGPWWAAVKALRSGDGEMGGADYSADEDELERLDDEEYAMQLLAQVHPGLGTLTTLDKMRKNYRKFGRPQHAREYFSIWPETYGVAAIDPKLWTAAGLVKPKPMPARVAFGMDIRPGGAYAAIAAAWRDSRGVAYISIADHKQSTAWLPARAVELMKYRGATIAYDAIGEQLASAAEIERQKPKPRLRVQTYRDHAAGCVQLMRDLERGKLRHFKHPGLTYAAEHAAKREPRGDAPSGVWLWTPSEEGADISPLVAATRALRNWDQHHAKRANSGSAAPIMGE